MDKVIDTGSAYVTRSQGFTQDAPQPYASSGIVYQKGLAARQKCSLSPMHAVFESAVGSE